MNKFIFTGNLSKKPEIKYSDKGTAVAKFRVIVKRPSKNRDEVDGFNCTAFGKQAENIANFLDKGSKVLVVGYVTITKSEQGQFWTDVIVNECEFLSPKNSNTPKDEEKLDSGQFEQGEAIDIQDDELPF
jgi:single-strand DNA-binding protein